MKEYKRLTERKNGIVYAIKKTKSNYVATIYEEQKKIDYEIYKRLAELEDKIEQGRLVDCIWFISWLNEEVCCGQVIGYEEDSGFVILTNGSMISTDKIWTNCEDAEKELLKIKIKELDKEEYQEFKAEAEAKLRELEFKERVDSGNAAIIVDSFDCGYHEHAKEKHDERVADTPNRIEFAKKQFEANNIDFTLKNEATGHFHCWRKSDNKLFQFYAGTGKIAGVGNKRGIHALIEILTK